MAHNIGLRTLGVMLGVAFFGGLATAAPVCTNITLVSQTVNNGTLIAPINPFTGASNDCAFDGFDFSNFAISVNTGYATPSNLTVTLSFSGNSLIFGTNMSQALGDDIDLQYKITPGIPGMILSASAVGGVNEGICSSQQTFGALTASIGFGACNGTPLGSGSVAGGSTTTILTTLSGTDWVFKDVNGVSGFTQTVIPEPMSLSLMGAGLFGLGLLRRIRKS
jgi:hypothetical protein